QDHALGEHGRALGRGALAEEICRAGDGDLLRRIVGEGRVLDLVLRVRQPREVDDVAVRAVIPVEADVVVAPYADAERERVRPGEDGDVPGDVVEGHVARRRRERRRRAGAAGA